jgi:hypothetical protein
MNSSNMRYLTIKEAAELTGKSESTIKRIARREKGNKKYFKYEKLPTGHQKVYVSISFLELQFGYKNSKVTKENDLLNSEETLGNKGVFVDFLIKENERLNDLLNNKDEKIFELMEKQAETVDKFLLVQDQAQKLQAMYSQKQLEEVIPKKRWWQWK